MAQALPFIAAGLSVAGGVMGLKAGRQQAAGYAAQATQARTQARGEALKYKEQGVAVLDNILRTQAAISARGAAGSVDPYSGSAGNLQQYALARGALETYAAEDNRLIAERTGEMRAQQLEAAAKASMSAAKGAFIMSLGKAAFSYAALGGPGFGGAPTGVNPFAGGTPTGVGLPGGEFGMTNLNVSGPGQLGARF